MLLADIRLAFLYVLGLLFVVIGCVIGKTKKTALDNNVSEQEEAIKQKKLLKEEFEKSLRLSGASFPNAKILLFTYASPDEHMSYEEDINFVRDYQKGSKIECVCKNNTTGTKSVYEIEIPEYFFVFHSAQELVEITESKFKEKPSVKEHHFSDSGYDELIKFFNEYKEKAQLLVSSLDENAGADVFGFEPILRLYNSNSMVVDYFREQLHNPNTVFIYEDYRSVFKENQKRTVLVSVDKNNLFTMEVFVGELKDGKIDISSHFVSLPEDFYDNGLSKEFIAEHSDVLINFYTFSFDNKQIIELKKQLDKIPVLSNEEICISIIPIKQKSEIEIEIIDLKNNERTAKSFDNREYLVLNMENLVRRITEVIGFSDETQISDFKNAFLNNSKIKELFCEKEKALVVNPNTNQENPNALELLEKLHRADAFYDIYGRMFSNSYYDGVSGTATMYNYIEVYDDRSVSDAVEQYLSLSEAHDILDWHKKEYNNYSFFMRISLDPWRHKSTFIIVNDSNMNLNDKELNRLSELCKANNLRIIKWDNGSYYEYTENRRFIIRSQDYPGSADDAATYCDYDIEYLDS